MEKQGWVVGIGAGVGGEGRRDAGGSWGRGVNQLTDIIYKAFDVTTPVPNLGSYVQQQLL